MTKPNRKITGMNPSVQQAVCLSVLLSTLTLLAACSLQRADDLAVAKLSTSQLQATGYLPLNADKPGAPVNVQQYLVPGKYTIVEYFSPYSDSYAIFEPRLVRLPEFRHDVAVRTVNVNRPGVQGVDWDSPIIQSVRIRSLPYFEIYDTTQKLRAHGRPAYEQVLQWIR